MHNEPYMQAENEAVADWLTKNNMGTTRSRESALLTIHLGFLLPEIKKKFYNDWRSLNALTPEKVAELVPDVILRSKLEGLLRELPKNS